jgi:hypothetical protein
MATYRFEMGFLLPAAAPPAGGGPSPAAELGRLGIGGGPVEADLNAPARCRSEVRSADVLARLRDGGEYGAPARGGPFEGRGGGATDW